jgi:3-deoxy-D-manno-octulosonic-acid transferase
MARRALSLSAYLAYARSASAPGEAPLWPDRPDGPMIWGFSDGAERGRALASLGARLQSTRPEVSVWLSGRTPDRPGLYSLPMPRDMAGEDLRRARRIAPDITLWAGQSLRPGLLSALHDAGSHLIALDIADAPFPTDTPRWLPDPAPPTLALFHSLYTTNPDASRRLRRIGLDRKRIHDATPFLDTEAPLDCADSLHEDIATSLAGRPVWLAARLRAEEAHDVLQAHRQASRLAHRLVLVIAPADAAAAKTIYQILAGAITRTKRPTKTRKSLSPGDLTTSVFGIGWPRWPFWAAPSWRVSAGRIRLRRPVWEPPSYMVRMSVITLRRTRVSSAPGPPASCAMQTHWVRPCRIW